MAKWCEHCRDHYPTEHYSEDGMEHLAGWEYGPVGRSMVAEQLLEKIITTPGVLHGGFDITEDEGKLIESIVLTKRAADDAA